MKLRSLLFVPGDSERKFAKAQACGADALILDLEDSVAPSMKLGARVHVAWRVADGDARPWRCFVRINPFETGLTLGDLAAVVRPGLDAVLLPKCDSAADVDQLGHYLDAFEQAAGMAVGTTRIAIVATETPAALFALGSYTPPHPRLIALTWGAEDLGAAIGASENKEADGSWTFPYQLARAQCLIAAAAAGVQPIDTLYADFRGQAGLAADCRRALRDGFTGRLAIHPDQVATINESFSPTEAQVAHARQVVAAFAEQPEAGAIGIDGRMYDIPHLKTARRTLAAAGER